jgi:hypothetical protein
MFVSLELCTALMAMVVIQHFAIILVTVGTEQMEQHVLHELVRLYKIGAN